MMTTVKGLAVIALAAASTLAGTGAHADLLFLGPDTIREEGHDNVTRLARLRANSVERGETRAIGGSASDRAIGTGRGIERRAVAPSFSSLDIEDASLLRIALSVSEPRNRRLEDLVLNDLTIRLQNGSGGQAPVTFSTGPSYLLHSNQLNAGEGFIFALDAAQAALANAFVAQGFDRITLSTSMSRTQTSYETFYAYAVPEPSTYTMLAAGLAALALVGLRRKRH